MSYRFLEKTNQIKLLFDTFEIFTKGKVCQIMFVWDKIFFNTSYNNNNDNNKWIYIASYSAR